MSDRLLVWCTAHPTILVLSLLVSVRLLRREEEETKRAEETLKH